MTKNKDEINECLPLIFHARRTAEQYGSIAEDAGTDRRSTQLFLHKILNEITGRVEISSTIAALCTLGGEAEVYTDRFCYVYVTAAIAYVKKRSSAKATTSDDADRMQGDSVDSDNDTDDHSSVDQIETAMTSTASSTHRNPIEELLQDPESDLPQIYDLNLPAENNLSIAPLKPTISRKSPLEPPKEMEMFSASFYNNPKRSHSRATSGTLHLSRTTPSSIILGRIRSNHRRSRN